MDAEPNRWGKDLDPVEEYIGDGVRIREIPYRSKERSSIDSISLLNGALAGLVAVVPMTLAMTLSQRIVSGRYRPLPPENVAKNAFEKINLEKEVPPYSLLFETAFTAGHFGYGMLTGSLYSVFSGWFPRMNPLIKGLGFGLLVWAASYPGWIPAAGLWSRSRATSKKNNLTLIFSHLVWGMGVGLLDHYERRSTRVSTSVR